MLDEDIFKSVTSVREELSRRGIDTKTQGLRGEERHKALIERLKLALKQTNLGATTPDDDLGTESQLKNHKRQTHYSPDQEANAKFVRDRQASLPAKNLLPKNAEAPSSKAFFWGNTQTVQAMHSTTKPPQHAWSESEPKPKKALPSAAVSKNFQNDASETFDASQTSSFSKKGLLKKGSSPSPTKDKKKVTFNLEQSSPRPRSAPQQAAAQERLKSKQDSSIQTQKKQVSAIPAVEKYKSEVEREQATHSKEKERIMAEFQLQKQKEKDINSKKNTREPNAEKSSQGLQRSATLESAASEISELSENSAGTIPLEEKQKIDNYRQLLSEGSMSVVSDISATSGLCRARIKALKRESRRLKAGIRKAQTERTDAIHSWTEGHTDRDALMDLFKEKLKMLVSETKRAQEESRRNVVTKITSPMVEGGEREMGPLELVQLLSHSRGVLLKRMELLKKAQDLPAYQEKARQVESMHPEYGLEKERSLQAELRRAEGELVAERATLRRSLRSASWAQDPNGKPPPPSEKPPEQKPRDPSERPNTGRPSSKEPIFDPSHRPLTPESSVQRTRRQVTLLKKEGKLEEAGKLYTELLERENEAEILCEYALFLQKHMKDHSLAEEYFIKAFEKEPESPGIITNYASFVSKVLCNIQEAEKLFKKAVEVPDGKNHAGALGNYAQFLHTVKKDFTSAEEVYRKALKANPKHANNMTNYARLLKDNGRHQQAEVMFKAALKVDPKSLPTLCNYANFLSKIRGKPSAAKELYCKGLSLYPMNQMLARNYGCFLRDFPEMRDGTGAKGYVKTRSKKKKKERRSCSPSLNKDSFRKRLSVLQETSHDEDS